MKKHRQDSQILNSFRHPSATPMPKAPSVPVVTIDSDFKPLGAMILCEIVTTNKSMIVLPESVAQEQKYCVVREVGPGYMSEYGVEMKPQVRKGDVVMLKSFMPITLRRGDKERNCVICGYADVLGVFPEAKVEEPDACPSPVVQQPA